MAWVGLERYGYLDDAQRLAYRFLYMMTSAFVDFNGVVPEKVGVFILRTRPHLIAFLQFDAVKLSHMVDAEYGNQGVDFKMVPREGFGWMNCTSSPTLTDALSLPLTHLISSFLAAYQVGLSFMTTHMRRAVATCTSPELFFKRSQNNVTAVDQVMLDAAAASTANADALSMVMDALNIGSNSVMERGRSSGSGAP